MSDENVELVRRTWKVSEEQGSLTAPFDEGLFAPELTITPARELPGAKTYVGPEGFDEFFRAWTGAFTQWRAWPERFVDAGNDRVVVVARQTGIGKGSGAEVEQKFGMVYVLGDGQVLDLRLYLDPAEALGAAGLSE